LKLATFNARAETVAEKPFFRGAFKRNRCLIPVSGYYEWQDTPDGKQPWYFTARDGSPALSIAGLWDEWHDKASIKTLKSFTMIITEPNAFVAEVHDRMPALLDASLLVETTGNYGYSGEDRGLRMLRNGLQYLRGAMKAFAALQRLAR
jgi:putative SOS response-associated peptidase YedK